MKHPATADDTQSWISEAKYTEAKSIQEAAEDLDEK
jgi:hypothetical protein